MRIGRLVRIGVCLLVGLAALGTAGCRREERSLTVTPAKIDFGRVVHRDRVERTFELHNHAEYPVMVMDVKPNCSCFKIHRFHRNLLPNEKRVVRVTFDSALVPPERLRGKKLDIVSNDARLPRLALPMEGEIVNVFGVSPTHLGLGEVGGPNRSTPWRVQIRGAPGMTVELEQARVQPEGLFAIGIEEADGGMDVVLTLEEDAEGEGPLRATLALRVSAQGPEVPQRSFVQAVRIEGTWP